MLQAIEKHPCAACGAQATWDPAKQLLVCPFCGTATPFRVHPSTGTIEELDLAKALRELSDDARGWNAAKRAVQCQSCKAVSVFDPERVAQNCGFCGSPALIDYAELKAPIRPSSLLPFKVSEAHVREQIRRWYASKWLAPGALKTRALVDRVRGIYIPYWTFDARAVCPWSADAGYYYYTTENYRDNQGRRQTRQVRHTRWEPAAGEVRHVFDDELIPGTHGVPHDLLKDVEPFPTAELVPYETAFLSGFVVEHYQTVLFEAADRAREAMTRKLYGLAAAQVPGDTHRNLQIEPRFTEQTFKHVLVPVWLLTYNYGTHAYQVIVNGYTGAMAGRYPKSPWKVALLVLLVILVVLIVLMLQEG